MRRPLEQRQLVRVLIWLLQESRVNDPATGQGQIGLDRVQVPVGCRQGAPVAAEDSALVEQPGLLESFLRAHRRLPLPGPRAAPDATLAQRPAEPDDLGFSA